MHNVFDLNSNNFAVISYLDISKNFMQTIIGKFNKFKKKKQKKFLDYMIKSNNNTKMFIKNIILIWNNGKSFKK